MKRHNEKEEEKKEGKKPIERHKKVLPHGTKQYDRREGSREIAKFNRAVVPVDDLSLDSRCRLRTAVYSGPAARLISDGT